MSLIPAMFQYIKKIVGANDEKQLAFAPLATPFTNEDFLFMNSEIFNKEPLKYYAEALEFSQKANSIIKKANIWEIDSEDFLYEKYEEILTHARLIEPRDLTEDERTAQEKARKVLFETDNIPTTAYKAYKMYEQQWADIKRKIELHKFEEPIEPPSVVDTWKSVLNQCEKELGEKELEWNAIGSKVEIENAMKAFNKPRENREREEFVIKWHEAKNFLNTIKDHSVVSGSPIFPMECIPNNLYQYKSSSWAKVNLTRDEIKSLTNELKRDSGNVDIALIFGEGAIDVEKISFEICRVILSRSWFNENLLLSRFWDYKDVKVSTGEKDNFDGLIPAYPIEFILVKNVDFTLSPTSAINETVKMKLKSGIPVSLGPFMLKNSFAKEIQNQPLKVQTFTNTQLNVISKSINAVNKDDVNSSPKLTKKKGIQVLQQIRTVKPGPQVIVHDHRIPGPTPLPRAGYIWVPATPSAAGHWERERATKLGQGKNVDENNQVISGKIVDENNQVISGAEITIIHTSSPVSQNDVSDSNGTFEITNIAKGNYHLTVKKEGFSIIEKEISLSGSVNMGIMNLSSLHPIESFLLLGVVYKKLTVRLPNPLLNELYS